MENLPVIQTTLDEWLQLTLAQPLYAAAIAIVVFLLTAFLYSIRISGLNKKNIASETRRTNAEASLNTAQQQLQQAQTELATANEQLNQQQKTAEAEKQRANDIEQQLAQRNQQIIAIIQRLASGFDIGEAPLLVVKDLKAEEQWQQHDKVITKLIEVLRTEQLAKTELQKFYQAEKDKVSATETRLLSLQTNLDSQTSLVSSLQIQNTALQQQQNTTQQALADAVQKHQFDLARLTELEQQLLKPTEKNTASKSIETIVAPTQTAAIVSAPPVDDGMEKLKSLFKKPEQAPHQEEIITQAEEPVQPESIVTDVLVTAKDNEPTVTEEVTDYDGNEQPESSSVIKGWYRKLAGKKSEAVAVEPEPVTEAKTEFVREPESVVESEPVVEETHEKTSNVSALKGFYQKFTTKTDVEPEPVTEPEPIVVEETYEKASGVSEVESKPEVKPAPVAETPEKTDPRKGFVKRFKKTSEIKLSDDEPSSRVEDIADKITDTVEGVKNLYGKFFSKNK
jgi:hypothetical protein